MVQHLIAPVDGSDASWRAVDVALSLARRADASVEVVQFVNDGSDAAPTESAVADRLRERDCTGVEVTTSVSVTRTSVAEELQALVDARPDGIVVMSSHGRGRSVSMLGSVTEALLRLTFGPIVVVGPHAEPHDFDGPLVATIDGSDASEFGLPLAAAWGIELGVDPWVVQVADPDLPTAGDAGESAHVARLARRIAEQSGHAAQFEVLHGRDVAAEISGFATSLGASLIVATTHGRTGMARLIMGSTAAAMVRHAPCPVILLRPPHLAST